MEKNDLIIVALQQRISELVGAYELQQANLRADFTEVVEKNKTLTETLGALRATLDEKSKEESLLEEVSKERDLLLNKIVSLENDIAKFNSAKKPQQKTAKSL